jgi:hypothetical protein
MEIINIIANIFFIVSLLLKFARTLYLYYRASKIAKTCGVHAGVPSSGAPFILRGGQWKDYCVWGIPQELGPVDEATTKLLSSTLAECKQAVHDTFEVVLYRAKESGFRSRNWGIETRLGRYAPPGGVYRSLNYDDHIKRCEADATFRCDADVAFGRLTGFGQIGNQMDYCPR